MVSVGGGGVSIDDFTNDDFGRNKQILADLLGHPLEDTTWGWIKLGKNTAELDIPAREGKFATCALLEYLSGGKTKYTIEGERHDVVRRFYAPLWNESGHESINFMREPGVYVELRYKKGDKLEGQVEELWEKQNEREAWLPSDVSYYVFELLNRGVIRAAEPVRGQPGMWTVNQWVKKAIKLNLRFLEADLMAGAFGGASCYDKIPSKFKGWNGMHFRKAGIRAVPPATARSGSFIGSGVVLMPSFVNIGAYVDDGTMVDTWATVGSCAQIGKGVHLSGGVGIGGVLEPLQAKPTIIEDGCFIGARSEVVEGVVVQKGAVLSMGVFIGKNTPIVDRTKNGEIIRGHVPENAVVMMGIHPTNELVCPHIVKYRDEKTDAATAINEMLRM